MRLELKARCSTQSPAHVESLRVVRKWQVLSGGGRTSTGAGAAGQLVQHGAQNSKPTMADVFPKQPF